MCCTGHLIEEEEDEQLYASGKHIVRDICSFHGSECWCYDVAQFSLPENYQHAHGTAASLFRVEDDGAAH